MPEAIHTFRVQVALRLTEVELDFSQFVEYDPKVSLVIFYRVRIHEDVVQVDVYETPDEVAEDGSHQSLESSRSVTVALLHDQTNERAIRCRECCLPDIF